MIPITIVGDGPRDQVALPELVKQIIGKNIRVTESFDWHTMHLRGAASGYARKLKFAYQAALRGKSAGLVATLDSDHLKGRLNELRKARDDEQAKQPLPAAVGEAHPHGEAWLLDDPVAVAQVLHLAEKAVPTVRNNSDPKKSMQELIEKSDRHEIPTALLAEIASCLQPKRCQHAKETGFDAFAGEVTREFGRL